MNNRLYLYVTSFTSLWRNDKNTKIVEWYKYGSSYNHNSHCRLTSHGNWLNKFDLDEKVTAAENFYELKIHSSVAFSVYWTCVVYLISKIPKFRNCRKLFYDVLCSLLLNTMHHIQKYTTILFFFSYYLCVC